MDFPCGSAGKESTCNAGDLGSTPGLGRSPGEGKGYPLQYSGLENFMDCISMGSQRVGHDWVTFTVILTVTQVHIHKITYTDNHPKFTVTLKFTLVSIHSMALDKYIMTLIYHCGISEYSYCPKTSSLLPYSSSWYFYCLHSSAFSRISYTWSHIVCRFFR